MKALLLLLMAAGPLLAEGHFAAPLGWESISPKELPEGIVSMVRKKTGGMLAATMNLAVEPTGLTLEQYMKEVELVHEDPSKMFAYLGSLQTEAGEMRVIQIDQKLSWTDVRIIQGILVKDKMAYVITATSEESSFPSLVRTMLQTMKTFSVQ